MEDVRGLRGGIRISSAKRVWVMSVGGGIGTFAVQGLAFAVSFGFERGSAEVDFQGLELVLMR